jgi:hypothetical protein
MRVIHLSTGHQGGAGLAARRLNQGLRHIGVNSNFYALKNNTFHPSNYEFYLSRSMVSKLISRLVTYLNLKLNQKVFFSLFNFATLNLKFFAFQKHKNAIFHFHNFFNLTAQHDIIKLSNSGYKVVVTLHDQRFFTGGCHYSFDCTGFKSLCSSCPQAPTILRFLVSKNMQRTRESLSLGTKLFIIAPSKWMKEQVIASNIVPAEQVRFIPNTLGPEFSVTPNLLKKPSQSGKYIIGIASMDTNSFIKGGDLVNNLRSESREKQLPISFVNLRDLKGSTKLLNFWESIDCLLVVSRADNSPNVIHEAKSFGIPVVGTAIGGITELLDPRFDLSVQLSRLSATDIYNHLHALSLSADYLEIQGQMIKRFADYAGDSIEEHLNYYSLISQFHK